MATMTNTATNPHPHPRPRLRPNPPDIHTQLSNLLATTNDHETRILAFALLTATINAILDKDGILGPTQQSYRDRLFTYGLQALRRLAIILQTTCAPDSSLAITRWPRSATAPRMRPPETAAARGKRRWAIQHQLDLPSNHAMILDVADTVLKLCVTDGEGTVLRFGSGEEYALPALEEGERDEEWKLEVRWYVVCAVYALAQLVSHQFGGKQVKVLGLSTVEA